MINAFFDTTALRSDKRRGSAAWKVVARLARLQKINLHLSDITLREFITSLQLDFDTALAKSSASLNDIRHLTIDETTLDVLQSHVKSFASHRDNLAKEVQQWIEGVKAAVHPVTGAHGIAVVDAYFLGSPPFAHVKSRNDIPDAFIYQAILSLSARTKPLHVITADEHLSAAAKAIEGIVVHQSLKDFLQASDVAPLTERPDNIDWFLTFVRSSKSTQNDEAIISQIESQLGGHEIDDFREDCEATVTGYGEVRDLTFFADDAEEFGQGIIAVPFTAIAECEISFFAGRWEFYATGTLPSDAFAEDWNENVLRVEDTRDLLIKGTLTFEAGPDVVDGGKLTMDEWATVLQHGTVDVEVEVVESANRTSVGDVGG